MIFQVEVPSEHVTIDVHAETQPDRGEQLDELCNALKSRKLKYSP